MKSPTRIALVGLGKIARDQHIPTIAANPDFELSCIVSRSATDADVPVYRTLEAAFENGVQIDAVSLCTPPSVRLELINCAMQHGCDIILEKPPVANQVEADQLQFLVRDYPHTVFATWHSRHAAMIESAREWTHAQSLNRVNIVWHEDVHKWHPNQSWLWQEGGVGVFDMGINALSILTTLHKADYHVANAHFQVPENAHAPVAVSMALGTSAGLEVDIDLDFLADGSEVWTMELFAENGERIMLFDGGAGMINASGKSFLSENQEYKNVYKRFSQLIESRSSDVDLQPLSIVSETFDVATRSITTKLLY